MFRITALALALLLVACGPDGGDNNDPAEGWQDAFDASQSGWLLSVAGASSSEVYAAGGTPEEGRLWRYDGSTWAEDELPEGVPLLNWVHVFDDGTPIIAGNGGTVLRREGDAWVAEQTPTEQDLWGIWGASPDDVWAVGGNGRDEGAATVLRRGADGTWQAQTLPEMERPNVRAFFKVWGTGADNVYIVGQRGAVLRWDGQALEELLVGTSEDLISLWGTGPDNIVMVGGRSNGVVVRFDGTEWTHASLAPTPGLNGVWMDEAETAWVAGNAGTLGRLDTAELSLETQPIDTTLEMHAIFGTGDALFSVGGNFGMPMGPYEGVALQRAAGGEGSR
ncbi:hypothetical protein FIV42_23970 [Persicimonas caeni]|uniref:Uncharacterized protein n=1 Tax=Persicimonas caeni TaxID=2292766 RepID=A0A4Y6PZD5_PERCE|nr:hypothetical protein [Persicimonas caeni]QDG53688.1 hypothetical protein FIV42_23970 [Persicimonas caeni]QED34909.1 hypothetical protein FRD00_23965 [Persicimonas caeni]